MPDKTDKILSEIESRLTQIYKKSEAEIKKKSQDFFENFKKVDEAMQNKLKKGKIRQKTYDAWRKEELLKGKQYEQMLKNVTAELANINKTALAYINGKLPEIYTLNYNSTGVSLADIANDKFSAGISFDLIDRDTVKHLSTKDRTLLPIKNLDIPKDKRWNRKKIQSELLQGIIQGESVDKIALRMVNVVGMNENSAIRNARTMVTGARNKGHLDAMKRSAALGIVTEKEWSAAGDAKTRTEHKALNGQSVKADEYFEVNGYKILYPGDPDAAPEMIYNCRCRIYENLIGFIDPETGHLKKVKL